MKDTKGGYTIKGRLSLLISVTIVTACGLVCAFYLAREWEELKSGMAEHVSWMAANAALLSGDSLAGGDGDALNAMIKTAMDTENGRHAFDGVALAGRMEVINNSGNIAAAADAGMSEGYRALMASRRAAAAGSDAPGAWEAVLADGCRLYGAYHPVLSDGRKVGAISVGVCDAPVRAAMRAGIRDSLGILLAAGLFGALVGRGISGWFSRPITELAKGAGELSSGNLDYRVELDSYKEMRILASSFNTMAWSLKEKMESLDESRKDALKLNEKLKRSFEEASRSAEKLEKLNEWATDMAFSLEEANQLLKEETVQTRTIVHSIRDGIVALDRNENVILMNPEAEELFDIRAEDARGRNVELLVDRLVGKIEEPESFLSKFMASTASPDSESEFSITVLKPYRKVLRRHSTAIRKDDGDVIGRVVTFTDITRQKEVDDMKTNFVSTVSHELRTPLTSIKGALTLLRDADILDQDTRGEFFAIAEQNTDRLIGLITNLLDLSRMEAGMASLKLARFDFNALVEAMVRSAQVVASRERVTIDAEYRAGSTEVLADRVKMEQVLSNLMDNAIKFSLPESRVRVVTEVEDEDLMLWVEDEGPGIPKDKLDKVFDKFYQLDMTPTRKVGGSGLGLAICRAIVNEHGGEIRALSPVRPDGRGARFEVRLPRTGIIFREKDHRRTPAMVEGSGAQPAGSRDTVLLVDDDSSLLKLQRRAFEKEGYRVLTAETGGQALLMAREHRPGFIFLDVQLPDLDGITVAGILKRDPATAGIPIVFATGRLDEERISKLEFGLGVIKKPFVEKDLISAVREYYG